MVSLVDSQLLAEGEILQSQVSTEVEDGNECNKENRQGLDHPADSGGSEEGSPIFAEDRSFGEGQDHC
jgi:hypothetical protein